MVVEEVLRIIDRYINALERFESEDYKPLFEIGILTADDHIICSDQFYDADCIYFARKLLLKLRSEIAAKPP